MKERRPASEGSGSLSLGWTLLHEPQQGQTLVETRGGGLERGLILTHLLLVSTAYWRFWLCVSVVYELFLIFILFQVGGFSCRLGYGDR